MAGHLYIGEGPYQEKLTQPPSRRERFTFINQLKRLAGTVPLGACVQVLPDDPKLPVVCFYDNTSDSKNYAMKLESVIPSHWDEEAKLELAQK